MLKDKILLITGGTGSFGKAVLSRFLKKDEFSEIRIFSRDEKKQESMRIDINNNKVKFYIGDVRDYQSINQAMSSVDFVFHAAALKQVPSCEFYPIEAIKTNILGAENVLQASIDNKVKNAVFLSTDKAVYPINAMGLSKAMMEKLVAAKSRTTTETTLCSTRYGNVMGSRGSVIPLFINQIKSNKPLTLTDPSMTRFMMSLEESVELVEYAFLNGFSGDTFVKKSPASSLMILAEALLEIFEVNNEIKLMGTRHGEKLYETLLTREEMAKAEDLGDYYRIPSDNRDLNYASYYTEGEEDISNKEDYNSHNTYRYNIEEMKSTLLELDIIKEALKV
ncbi:polysaccharide biosynthesis protein [SAR86 cluster bacterium]|nr:polysaccharide biosynthesis protein [SAR86 cluster bacterium]